MTTADSESLATQVARRALQRRQAAHEAEVRTLIDAGFKVMAESGDFTPTVRQILAEAGLSNPAFYRHFTGKDELLLVMVDEGTRQLVSYLEHRVSSITDPARRLEEWVRGVMAQTSDVEAAERTRPFYSERAVLRRSFPEELRRSEQQLIDQLAALLGPVASQAELVYVTVIGVLGRHLDARTVPTSAELDALVAFVLAALDLR